MRQGFVCACAGADSGLFEMISGVILGVQMGWVRRAHQSVGVHSGWCPEAGVAAAASGDIAGLAPGSWLFSVTTCKKLVKIGHD